MWGNDGVCGKDRFVVFAVVCLCSEKQVSKPPGGGGGAQGAGGAVSPCAQAGDRAAATSPCLSEC